MRGVLMPIIYHSIKTTHIKNFLNVFYDIKFNKEDAAQIEKIKKDTRNSDDAYKKLLKLANEKCKTILPYDAMDYLRTGNNYAKSEKAIDDLLKYVFMDTLLNLQANDFTLSPPKTRYIQSQADFFRYLTDSTRVQSLNDKKIITGSHCNQSNDFNTDNSNFNHLFNNARTRPWFNELYDYYVPSPDQRPKTKTKSGGVNDKPVSSYMPKLLGVLIYKSNSCPYYKIGKQQSLSIKLTKKYLSFVYCALLSEQDKYRLIDNKFDKHIKSDENNKEDKKCGSSALNFSENDKLKQICEWYFLDSIYDPETNIYIAEKLSGLKNYKPYSSYKTKKFNTIINDLTDILCLAILIPDVFSKKTYIDIIFDAIYENNRCICDYYQIVKKGRDEADKYSENAKNKKIRKEIFESCYEYILYLSKIYLPVLSMCFYVLLVEYIKTSTAENIALNDAIAKIVEDFAEKHIFSYYENKIVSFKNGFTGLTEYNEKYFLTLYQKSYTNIFSDEKKYKDIKASLNIEYATSHTLKMYMLNNMIRMKIENSDDFGDPIPFEHSLAGKNGIREIFEMNIKKTDT